MDPTIDIIVVNWNTGGQLRECLDTLSRALTPLVHLGRVVVVDNASVDGSADGLETLAFVTVLRNPVNLGFAKACNQGASGSRSDYILFLNPDTRLDEDSLQKPIEFLEATENGHYGICGIQLRDEKNVITRSCARYPTAKSMASQALGLFKFFPRTFPRYHMDDWEHDRSRSVDHVIGAFFLVRRKLFESLGGFDERFFVYLEDLDFSLRAFKANSKTYYLASATAFHRGGGSSERVKARRLFYALSSRIFFVRKHFPRSSALLIEFLTLCVEPIIRIGSGVARLSLSTITETVEAYRLLYPAICWASFKSGNAESLYDQTSVSR